MALSQTRKLRLGRQLVVEAGLEASAVGEVGRAVTRAAGLVRCPPAMQSACSALGVCPGKLE